MKPKDLIILTGNIGSGKSILTKQYQAKGYVVISTAAADLDSHNVASITDNGVGDYTINWTTDFSSANYTVTGSVFSSGLLILTIVGQAAGTTQVNILTNAGAASETGVTHVSVAALGDQ